MTDASDERPPEQAGDPPDGADAKPPAGSDEGERERPTADAVEEKYDFYLMLEHSV
jgi:hypothetical protein